MKDKMAFDEEMATEYDRGVRRTLPTYDALLKLTKTYLGKHTPDTANVLIIGAGGGNELVTLGPAQPEWSFTAVDPAPPMLDIARMKAEALDLSGRVKFIEGTATDVPQEKMYDAATCLLVLHFIPDKVDKLHLLKKIRQHLHPHAPFVLATMYGNPDSPAFDELFELWKDYWLDSTDLSTEEVDEMETAVRTLSFIQEDKIEAMLEEAGFTNITNFFKTNLFGGWICRATTK